MPRTVTLALISDGGVLLGALPPFDVEVPWWQERLELAAGRTAVWLKQVPRFFAHEPAVLRWLGDAGLGDLVPGLLATDGRRMLLGHLPGADLYGADAAVLDAIAAGNHRIQTVAAGRLPELLDLGMPDWRAPSLTALISKVVSQYAEGDPRLEALVAGLPDRFAAVAACGLPDTLVHGDLHPGNAHGDADRQVILDWGDSFAGHPAFDILRLTERVAEHDAAKLTEAWAARWRETVPGSDPMRAADLLRPVAALRNAVCYAEFLAKIEPAEHPYHVEDVPFWLADAAAQA